MRYGIDIGHNAPPDTGAMSGYEDELNKELGLKVAAGLASLNHNAIIVNPGTRVWSVGHSLRMRCDNANAEKCDRFVSFHFNAFNTRAFGTEVYYLSQAGYRMAKPVVDEICNLKVGRFQMFNRGAKKTSYFQVLNNTNMPAILIETAFCDNPQDMKTYNAIGSDEVAKAIIRGLTGKDPLSFCSDVSITKKYNVCL